MHFIETRMFDIFTCVFDDSYSHVEDSREFTHVGIANTLQALTTHYEFTCKFFVFSIQPGVNILLDGYHYLEIMTSKQCRKSMTSFHVLCV